MERGCHPELKSVEFVFYTKRVSEIFDVHAGFTAGQMRPLYQSMTRTSPLAYLAVCKPGLGLVTSQALGPVAGFSVDSAGKILGVDGGEVQYPPPPKCCCAFDSLGP